MIETGKNIKRLLDKNDYKVSDLPNNLLPVSTTNAIYKWINGQSLPTVDNLVILAKLFDCSMDDILVLEDDDHDGQGRVKSNGTGGVNPDGTGGVNPDGTGGGESNGLETRPDYYYCWSMKECFHALT